jgi:MoaA/NifB/PqqE/SkfB family radical SAM enzyme
MCLVYKNNYVISDKIFIFIKNNIPYLETVVWQGGEVFLYERFDELIELAGYYGVKQTILTNGLLLNKKRIDILSKYNIKVKISIDAVDKKLYEKIREGGKFDNLLNILKQLKKEKSKNKKFGYMMAVVVNTLNYKDLKKIVDFAVKHGFECITFQNFIINSPFQREDLSLNEDQAKVTLKEISYLINKSLDGSIPIKIETNFNLNSIDDLMYSYVHFLNMKDYFKKTAVDGSYSLSFVKSHESNDEPLLNNKLKCFESWGIDKSFNPVFNKCKLFCISPWTKIYFDINNIMRSVCNGYDIDISNSFDNIWNNDKLVEYREEIVKCNISKCRIICRNTGEYGYKTKLGIC